MKSLEQLWNEKEVADYTGLSLSTIRKMRHFGRGPVYYKIGGRVVYAPQDVWDYICSKRIDPTIHGEKTGNAGKGVQS